ncbi:MAG: valine--tRNA ligase, partial [Candidatus Omnitrophica bacterium]|nr:valine--tRNA ligase [Candidatus Omnitrophota bacterium]
RELQGNLYYLRYPLKENPYEYVVVATTRPETMLGDTAVCVNPKDRRYKKFIGKTLILPLINREIKIIADSIVDVKFGTGAVKVTPAHDPNDYEMGTKHKLEFVNVMSEDGRMNDNAQDYKGMDRFEAREVILEDLKEKGLLEKVEPHNLSAGHCYRCHTIIEPYLSRQWFVKMAPLAKPAIEAVKSGKIKFHPARWTKVYLNWMENIQDWCISRQIWWGHRIPLWYCKDCGKMSVSVKDDLKECPKCRSANIKQDEDVLDTWFSSWLWPFATFYWPSQLPVASSQLSDKDNLVTKNRQLKTDLEYFYPTSVLVTAPEIIFFWVARMIMAGFEFMGDVPFKDVYIHGTVRDIEGKKMSKSLGNIIDPLEIIEEYGADALRFSLISTTAQGQDVFLSKERFEQGRNFANKIWNASRLVLLNLDDKYIDTDLCVFFKSERLSLVNRWILSRFYEVLKEADKDLDSFRFNEAANSLYGFFWHEFCDWYLEIIKADMKKEENQIVMHKVLEKFLRTLHPFMPFVTEEIWHKLYPGHKSIMVEPWPHIQEEMIDKKSQAQMELIFGVIRTIRNLRSSLEIRPDQKVTVSAYAHTKPKKQLLEDNYAIMQNLSKLETLRILDNNTRPYSVISDISEGMDLYLHFSGLIDVSSEVAKIENKIKNIKQNIKAKEERLKNKDFRKKAPQEIVKKEEESIKEGRGALERLMRMKDELR